MTELRNDRTIHFLFVWTSAASRLQRHTATVNTVHSIDANGADGKCTGRDNAIILIASGPGAGQPIRPDAFRMYANTSSSRPCVSDAHRDTDLAVWLWTRFMSNSQSRSDAVADFDRTGASVSLGTRNYSDIFLFKGKSLEALQHVSSSLTKQIKSNLISEIIFIFLKFHRVYTFCYL